MNGIGEIHRRRTPWQVDQVAPGGKAEDLVFEHFQLRVFEEFLRLLGMLENIQKFVQPPVLGAGGGAGANAKTTADGNGAKTKTPAGSDDKNQKTPSPKKTAHEQAVGYWVFDAQQTANTDTFKAVSAKATGAADVVNQFDGLWMHIEKAKIDTGQGDEGESEAYTVAESTDNSIIIFNRFLGWHFK